MDGIQPPATSTPAPTPVAVAATLAPGENPVTAEELIAGHPSRRSRLRLALVVLAALAVLGGGVFALVLRLARTAPGQASDFRAVTLPLSGFGAGALSAPGASSLKVNGDLRVANTVVLGGIDRPAKAVAGQLFYDKLINQLTYSNGQDFIAVGSGNTTNTVNTTNVTNRITNLTEVLSGAGAGVQLQSTAPGVQQAGNFNVSGTGAVGKLATTVIDSGGSTLYVNPVGATQQQTIAPGTPSTVGLTNGSLTTGPGGGWANDLTATKVTLGAVGGTTTSIGIFFAGGSASKHVQVALYDDDGDVPSKPGARLATSAVVNLVPGGITTVPIPAVNLSPNATYWLASNTDDTTVDRTYNGGTNMSCFVTSAFGFMPDPFSTSGCFNDNADYTVFLNYAAGSGPSGSISQATLTFGPSGQTVFRNAIDSTSAFQIQNAAGTTNVFNVDTTNARIAIGKANASYKLDIAGGDINLSIGRSLRVSGSPVLTATSAGITSLSSFVAGGSVRVQGDSFTVQDASASHANLTINNANGATVFANRTDSATAFQIQNAAGTPLLVADTSTLRLYVGDPAGSASPVLLVLANKTTAGDPAGTEGATYYSAASGSFRCYSSGSWHACSDPDPRRSFSLYDEFTGGGTSFAGPIGSLGWTAVAIGANGTLTLNPSTPPPSADRPGVLGLRTPAVAGQGSTLMLGDTTGGSMMVSADNELKTGVAVGAATGQVLRVGLHTETSGTAQPVSGVWWEADPAAGPKWRYCYGDGATATCAASGVAIVAGSWVSLGLHVTAIGPTTSAATFTINQAPVTVTGITIDTATRVSPAFSCVSTTAAAHDCYWDYFQLTGNTAAAR